LNPGWVWIYEKIDIFNQYVTLCWKRYKTGPWNANRNSYVICRMVPFTMTLS